MKPGTAVAVILSAWVAAAPALAEEACVERSDFLDHLLVQYGEAPVAMGVTASGKMLEVVVSDSGSWTIIVTLPNGVSCGLASGEGWESFPAKPRREPA